MKLLFYLPGLVDGGAERVMANLANWFALQGHEVSLVVDFEAGENRPLLEACVQSLQLSKDHFSSIQQLAKLLIDHNPDIVISAIASANFKIVAASVLARARTLSKPGASSKAPKLVLTYHGFDEHKTGKLSWLGYKNLPLMSKYASAVVAVSDSLLEALVDRWKAKRKKLVRIYNPVKIPSTPEEFDPNSIADRDDIILSVGRLVPGKRFDLLIEALAKMKCQSATLTILGEGPERQSLEQLVAKLGLQDRVEMPGFCSETGHYYARAKCFALTSEKESFGLVLVEAMAFGLPVIATDCGGPREVLDDGRFGVLVANNPPPHDLAIELDKVLQNPGTPAPRIERAALFDMETGARQYGDLFEKILENQPKA